MVNLLAKLLSPIFEPMGVSQADLLSYIGMVQSYVWVILAAIVALIVVLILAKNAKKGKKHLIRWSAVLAWLAIVALTVNLMCYGPLKNNISTVLNAHDVTLSEETTARSKDTVKKVGEEGFVLLKNNGLLPLSADTKNLNVFGWASTNPIYGGTGSGSSDSSLNTGILEGLKLAGYTTNAELTKVYTDYATGRAGAATGAASITAQSWNLPEPTREVYTESLMSGAKDFSDVAVIVISRSGGEGADLPMDMNALIHGTYGAEALASSVVPDNYTYFNGVYDNNGTTDDFDPGESYLELSNPEEDMIAAVCENFDNVIVVINSNNTMELGWVDEYEQIGAVIFAPGPGVTGFAALGEIISGAVNPSGRTVDTFVKDLFNTPTSNNFGNFAYNNVDDLKETVAAADSAYQGSMAFVNYVEGIYVGYKYYETAYDEAVKAAAEAEATAAAVAEAEESEEAEEGEADPVESAVTFDYDSFVQYPFGYGLSYTTFEQKIENFAADGDVITFDVSVTNTGDTAGKDVVEVYFTPPYTNGGIEKASVNLIQFEKTGELAPGASETVHFSIPKEDMAAYDVGLKVSGGGYILEAGTYTISVRANSHTVIDSADFTVDADIDYSTGRSSDLVPATNQFEDYSRGDFVQLSRKDGFANYEEATAAPAEDAYIMSDEIREVVSAGAAGIYDPTAYDNAGDTMPTQGAKKQLELYQLTGASYDDPRWEQLIDQMSFADMTTLVNIGGWQTAAIDSVGKIATSDCDGPAGLNNFITGAYGTSYPGEIVMAHTWNKNLVEEIGRSMTAEYVEAYNFGWYGPAMNTHRNAFAGRNFEYYSEDGVLAGYLAAAEINGAVGTGVYPYIKHFALNDQETNRCSFLLTFASEQAIREIYLKPFEIAVKNYTGTPLAVMSSFNFIGTQPSTANPNLLNNVLRGEWGFVGMVETDYDGSYGYMISDKSVRNGNDLMLGFGFMPTDAFTDESATATLALRQASKNILYTIANSGYYLEGNPNAGMNNMDKLFVGIDAGIGVLIVALAAIVFGRYFSKKKKAKAA